MSGSSEINEDLRNLSWEILITRDDLLRIAEKLPEQTRERAHQTAGKLAPLCSNVQRLLKSLPAGVTLPEDTLKNLLGLRDSIVLTLKEAQGPHDGAARDHRGRRATAPGYQLIPS